MTSTNVGLRLMDGSFYSLLDTLRTSLTKVIPNGFKPLKQGRCRQSHRANSHWTF